MSQWFGINFGEADAPGIVAINAKLRELGYDLVIDPDGWGEYEGFVPAMLMGERSGVETYFPEESEGATGPNGLGGTKQLAFSVGGSDRELAVASCIQHAVLELVDATPFYESEPQPREELIDQARSTYFTLRYTLARVSVGDAGLPPEEPPIAAPFETAELREKFLDYLTTSRRLREVAETGNLRLSLQERESLARYAIGNDS
ncbi:MAG: hypothetical protein AAGI53_11420 [Planctomycetota bacterium]